ncbi:AHH domain-containing protein [Archangium violaceum]|uniref:AHH domain-containing protein n=1 Tax=Archangium violaceum TaxID=83451 RepID=UPI0037C167FD
MPDAKQRKATLSRNSKYRQNGYEHIRDTGSRTKVYSSDAKIKNIMAVLQKRGTQPNPKGVAAGSEKHAKRYTFKYKNNFSVGSRPYSNEAHHMVPESAFSEKFFTPDQIKLLWMVQYDVNNKENIIFLPEVEQDSDFHLLPSHSGDHPKYTAKVSGDMKEVRKSLNKVINKDPDHKNWSPPNDVPTRLIDLQKKYWRFLVNCGPMPVNTFKKPASHHKGKPRSKGGPKNRFTV